MSLTLLGNWGERLGGMSAANKRAVSRMKGISICLPNIAHFDQPQRSRVILSKSSNCSQIVNQFLKNKLPVHKTLLTNKMYVL